LNELQELQQQNPENQAIASNLAYLQKRRDQMQYPLFQSQGWPIGSGIVESGNKLVVEARLKGSGMHWAEQHVNSLLAIRNIICSDRWKEDWPKIESRLRQQTRLRRNQLHQSRLLILQTIVPELAPMPKVVPVPSMPEPTQTQNTPKKPKTNPWRKFKFGKALYQRSSLPKI